MTRRSSRGFGLPDPIPMLEKLRPGREAIIAELRGIRPTSPHYHMLHLVLSAIDVAAEFLSGSRAYYLNPTPDQIGRSANPDA